MTTMTDSFITKKGFFFLQLVFVAAQVRTNTECVAKYENDLTCKFPENINNTRKDFSVYFYPDTGGEELLVDCEWMDAQLDCIEQKGFKCWQPVSDSANITVSVSFVNRTGSYMCKADGIPLENMNPCRFHETQVDFGEKELNSSCEAHTTLEGRQLIVNCIFSIDVEQFTIEHNNTVVASYTKPFCRTSDVCLYHFGNNHHVYTVKLEDPGYLDSELRCYPYYPTPQLHVEGCRAEANTNIKKFPTIAVVLSVFFVLSTI